MRLNWPASNTWLAGKTINCWSTNVLPEIKSLNIVIKHVFICSNPYIYTTVVQEVYNRDHSPEVYDVEGLAAAATKHLELLKQKNKAESSFSSFSLRNPDVW